MKKICIVSPSLKVGGIQRELVELANYYSKNNQVVFITIFKSKYFYKLSKDVDFIDISYKREMKESFTSQLWYYVKILYNLRFQINTISPDVVLTYGDIMGPLVLLSLYKANHKVFIGDKTSHDYRFNFAIRFLKKWLYPKSQGYIAQTEKAAKYRYEQFKGKLNITVIHNGIRDVKLFPNIKREKIILYLGRFAWEKSPERLILSMTMLKNEDWKLIMAGDGPLLSKMKQYAKELNISSRVEFLGQVKEVDKLFAKSSIYVLPSIIEGFPNALCEAMAAGLPSIVFDSIPYEDILTDNFDGIVVSDVYELSKNLDNLIQNQELRNYLGENARNIAVKLSKDKAANKLYEKLFVS
ncbi:glycosyltransferase [Psychroflexus sp. ALD_RP9]|uniref:glycosyltransferase n=1 Tax=Psychroflexus sp. ALD_RP9 TaxID=2777186 RepID=UPI001A8D718A|nr:glycosyltransferase [Psychroflexus sp. ALD_RP9]QSS98026.1 glycosyltransferase [Psychroflexus sp. ALD_RP9]